MRHFLAKILNCATSLVAALPAIFLVPSGVSDSATIISFGRELLPGDAIRAQRNQIFSPGPETNRIPSIAPDLIVGRASMSFGLEPVEVGPSSPGSHLEKRVSTIAYSDPEQSEGAADERPNLHECVATALTTNSNLRSNPTYGSTGRTLAELPRLAPICSRRRAPVTP